MKNWLFIIAICVVLLTGCGLDQDRAWTPSITKESKQEYIDAAIEILKNEKDVIGAYNESWSDSYGFSFGKGVRYSSKKSAEADRDNWAYEIKLYDTTYTDVVYIVILDYDTKELIRIDIPPKYEKDGNSTITYHWNEETHKWN